MLAIQQVPISDAASPQVVPDPSIHGQPISLLSALNRVSTMIANFTHKWPCQSSSSLRPGEGKECYKREDQSPTMPRSTMYDCSLSAPGGCPSNRLNQLSYFSLLLMEPLKCGPPPSQPLKFFWIANQRLSIDCPSRFLNSLGKTWGSLWGSLSSPKHVAAYSPACCCNSLTN